MEFIYVCEILKIKIKIQMCIVKKAPWSASVFHEIWVHRCLLASLPRWETFIYFKSQPNEVEGKKEQKNLTNLFELLIKCQLSDIWCIITSFNLSRWHNQKDQKEGGILTVRFQ